MKIVKVVTGEDFDNAFFVQNGVIFPNIDGKTIKKTATGLLFVDFQESLRGRTINIQNIDGSLSVVGGKQDLSENREWEVAISDEWQTKINTAYEAIHLPVSLSGENYLSLNPTTQVITAGKVNLVNHTIGVLDIVRGGTGLSTVGTSGQLLRSNGSVLEYWTPNYTTESWVNSQGFLKSSDIDLSFNTSTGELSIEGIDTVSLDGRYSLINHTHAISDITYLQSTLTSLQSQIDGKEASFTKGSIVQGTGLSLTGTLENRLVGSGNITFNINSSYSGFLNYYTKTEIDALLASTHPAVTLGTSNGLSLNVQELSLALATTTSAGAMSAADKVKLNGLSNYTHPTHTSRNITTTGTQVLSTFTSDTLGHVTGITVRDLTLSDLGYTPYTLPTATSSILGGVKIGDNISITDGIISVAAPYIHPTQTAISVTTTGVEVMSTVTVDTLGHITAFTKRTLPTASASVTGVLSSTNWTTFNNKQDLLVSGTNIKTLNGVTVLGSGDLVVGGVTVKDKDDLVQWTTSDGNKDIRFEGTGDTSIAFNSTTRTVIISSVPGSGGGSIGLVSFNGRTDAAATPTSGDYDIDMMGDVAITTPINLNILQYDSSINRWKNVVLNTSIVPESGNLYFTQARARTAISLTTTGNSGVATYNNTTGVFNVPNYTLAGLGGQPLNAILTSIAGLSNATTGLIKLTNGVASLDTSTYLTTSRNLTINGTSERVSVSGGTQTLAADRTWTVDLASSGVTAGTYSSVTVDVYGRVTSGGVMSLAGLSDTAITTPTIGNLLRYDGTTWINWIPNFLTGNQTVTLSGDVTGSGTTAITTTIANNAVTFAKIQDISTASIIGRYSAGTGDPQSITLGTGLTLNTSTGVLSATGTGGTVTTFSAGNLSPLFTTSVATATSTPVLSFTLTNAGANTWFGNASGSATTPSYNNLSALTKVDDSNITLTLGGTPTTALLKAVSLTLGWNGFLSVARGGTGVGTLTGVVIGNGASVMSGVVGTANQILRRNAANTGYEFFTPTWTSTNGTVTSITIGNGLTGTSPITTAGTITLGTPSNITLASTNTVGATTHSHAFVPGGTTAQYIRGDGSLITFPTIPTVGNGTLTINTSYNLTGSVSFSANQSGNGSITIGLPDYNDTTPEGMSSTVGGTSQFGQYLLSSDNGNFVIGIRNNNVDDSFAVVSKSTNSGSSGVFDRLVFRVQAGGLVRLFSLSGASSRLVYSTTNGDLNNLENGTTGQFLRGDMTWQAIPTNATLTRGTGLTGGNYNGTAAQTWAVSFGTAAGTAAQGNDSRILNGQTAFGWGNHAGLYSLLSHNHTLDSLSNVTITSNSNGEILKWNGSAWINNTLAEASIANAIRTITTSGDGLTGGGDLTANRVISVASGYAIPTTAQIEDWNGASASGSFVSRINDEYSIGGQKFWNNRQVSKYITVIGLEYLTGLSEINSLEFHQGDRRWLLTSTAWDNAVGQVFGGYIDSTYNGSQPFLSNNQFKSSGNGDPWNFYVAGAFTYNIMGGTFNWATSQEFGNGVGMHTSLTWTTRMSLTRTGVLTVGSIQLTQGTPLEGRVWTATDNEGRGEWRVPTGGDPAVPLTRTLSINGVTYDLTANRSWTVDTSKWTTTGSNIYRNSRVFVNMNSDVTYTGLTSYNSATFKVNGTIGVADHSSPGHTAIIDSAGFVLRLLDNNMHLGMYATGNTGYIAVGNAIDSFTFGRIGVSGFTYFRSSGNTVIHNTANAISSPTYALTVYTNSDTADGLYVRGKIYATNEWSGTSDERVKSNIRKITDPLEKLKRIAGYTYTREGGLYGGHIAQEVMKVFPFSVTLEHNNLYSLNDRPILALHTEAIKALNLKQETLQEKVIRLEERIKELENGTTC